MILPESTTLAPRIRRWALPRAAFGRLAVILLVAGIVASGIASNADAALIVAIPDHNDGDSIGMDGQSAPATPHQQHVDHDELPVGNMGDASTSSVGGHGTQPVDVNVQTVPKPSSQWRRCGELALNFPNPPPSSLLRPPRSV